MRGQSAVEYLVTYGWAILALIVVLGVLLSSGVLTPNYIIAEECNAGNNFPCAFALFNEGGESRLSLVLYNAFPYAVQIESIEITSPDEDESFTLDSFDSRLESGTNTSIMGTYPELLPEDAYKKFYISIRYASCASELLEPGEDCSTSYHTVSGRVAGRVIKEES